MQGPDQPRKTVCGSEAITGNQRYEILSRGQRAGSEAQNRSRQEVSPWAGHLCLGTQMAEPDSNQHYQHSSDRD